MVGYSLRMSRTVRKELISAFIKKQERDGIRVLSELSKIPTSSISKIRAGRVPKDPLKREALAEALGVEESELFPSAKGKSRAS